MLLLLTKTNTIFNLTCCISARGLVPEASTRVRSLGMDVESLLRRVHLRAAVDTHTDVVYDLSLNPPERLSHTYPPLRTSKRTAAQVPLVRGRLG